MSLTAEQRAWVADSSLRGPDFSASDDPAPRLIVFGAVPLAAALTTLAGAAGWRPFLIDPRAHHATRERFPSAEAVIVAWPREAIEALGGIDGRTAIAVLAHDPILDDPALIIALRSPAVYVGAMGSRRTQAARRERLSEAGLTALELDRLSGPAGLDLGARTVQETAVSILAEMIAARHGHGGGRLSRSGGPIHAAAS